MADWYSAGHHRSFSGHLGRLPARIFKLGHYRNMRGDTMKRKPELDPKDRDQVTMTDLEDAVRQLTETPSGKTKSTNREPTKEELGRRFRVVRR